MATRTGERTFLCPVCASAAVAPFARLDRVPVLCNSLWPTRVEALGAPRGDIELAFCTVCGMIANVAFDAGLIGYDTGYENSLHFSRVFQDYAVGLARRLVDTYGIRGKTVVEIGSGKGDFLTLMCQTGDNEGIGYDPSYDESVGVPGADDRVRFVPRLWDGQIASADLVCCRQVLEHIEEPRTFVGGLATALAGGDAVVYFEVPDAAHMLKASAVYDVIYEHCSYFAAPPLARLFSDAGFHVNRVGSSFGDQYLYLEATSVHGRGAPPPAATSTDELAELVRSFDEHLHASVDGWGERLATLHDRGLDVVVWGAGSKGVTFLNVVPGGDRVARIVDVNPRKRNRFVPVSGQQVVGPEDLEHAPPHTVVVMNHLYLDEVRARLAHVGLTPEVVGV